jgi:hypothetical protein
MNSYSYIQHYRRGRNTLRVVVQKTTIFGRHVIIPTGVMGIGLISPDARLPKTVAGLPINALGFYLPAVADNFSASSKQTTSLFIFTFFPCRQHFLPSDL